MVDQSSDQEQTGQLRVAMAQINPKVGDFAGNTRLVLEYAHKARHAGAHIVVFPEMALSGYPVEDLALRATFRVASKLALTELAQQLIDCGDLVTIVGYLDESEKQQPQNAAAFIHQGKVVATYKKHHLPNYGVFDEYRNFVPGTESLVVRVHGIDVGIAICEDIWHEAGLIPTLVARKPGLVIVPNGSPYERNKDDLRAALVQKRAREFDAPMLYVNMTGGQDDLVFDGDSIAVSSNGEIIARAPQFFDGLMIVDVECVSVTSVPDVIVSQECITTYQKIIHGIANRLGTEAEIWEALVVGLRDYVLKNGFPSVILGLSGGIDSAVTAAIAADAIGAEKVFGVAMPSKYSSQHSLSDAADSAERIGLNYRVLGIQPMVDAFLTHVGLTGLAEENVQARVRGTTLMGLSNQEGHLVLATGNKSELAVGYSTMYGDAVGGFAPIKDLLKSEVWRIARWRNRVALERGETPPIPENSITKEPSAELRPDQKDSDSLPEYEILDQILTIYIENDGGLQGLLDAGFDADLAVRVIKMVDGAEYKRRQYPPGTKISLRAFGKDRRLPITSGWKEISPE
jgi:NAD+ synthase (glutamine-hydrolysing)